MPDDERTKQETGLGTILFASFIGNILIFNGLDLLFPTESINQTEAGLGIFVLLATLYALSERIRCKSL